MKRIYNSIFDYQTPKFSSTQDVYLFLRNTGCLFGEFEKKPECFTNNDWKKLNYKQKVNAWFLFSCYAIFKNRASESDFESILMSFYESNFQLTDDLELILEKRIWTKNVKGKIIQHINLFFAIDFFLFGDYLLEKKNKNIYQGIKRKVIELVLPVFDKRKLIQDEKLFYKILLNNLELNQSKSTDFAHLSLWAKKYILEFVYFVILLDSQVSDAENEILEELVVSLNISEIEKEESIVFVQDVLKNNDFVFFNIQANWKLVKLKLKDNFQAQILKNKDRIISEVSESKELLRLLSKSTKTKLSPEEQVFVKNQLKDILKVIPTVSLFLLPAGSLLVPIIIRLLPPRLLLPSSFLDENN